MDNQNTYRTKNLFVASYLICTNKINFVGIETLDKSTKLFVFSPKETAQQLVTEYFSGGQISAKTLFAEYNNLKDMLFQRDPNGETTYGEYK